MPFFRDLIAPAISEGAGPSPTFLVMSESDLSALDRLLAKVPYEYAEPIMRAFSQASALQRNAGMLEVVDKVLELHRSAIARRDRAPSEDARH